MHIIELIVGNNHEGKTRELITKYYNFCKGTTLIEEDGVNKTFKNYDLVKPYFICIEEEPQVLRNMIKNIALEDNTKNYKLKSENFDTSILNTIEAKSKDTTFLSQIFDVSGDKILYVDFNLSLEELNYFLKDFHYQTQEYKYNIDLYISVTKPIYLKDE